MKERRTFRVTQGANIGFYEAGRTVSPLTLLLLMFIGSGAVVIGVSIPLALGRIPPNSWYGFRVPRTLADPDVWYAANRYGGRLGFWLGGFVMASAVGFYFVPGISVEEYAWTILGVVVLGMAAVLVLLFRYLQTLPQ